MAGRRKGKCEAPGGLRLRVVCLRNSGGGEG